MSGKKFPNGRFQALSSGNLRVVSKKEFGRAEIGFVLWKWGEILNPKLEIQDKHEIRNAKTKKILATNFHQWARIIIDFNGLEKAQKTQKNKELKDCITKILAAGGSGEWGCFLGLLG